MGKCQECARLRAEAKEQARKLQLKRLAQTLKEGAKKIVSGEK